MSIVDWFEGTALVVHSDGRPRLSVNGGRLHDDRGGIVGFDALLIPSTLYALAIYVGEWLIRRFDRDGPTDFAHIHPVLRGAVRQLAPGVVEVAAADDGHVWLRGGANGLH